MNAAAISRRSFLSLLGATPLALRALAAERAPGKLIPFGLQMYSVRDDEKHDLMGTLKGLREMGHECVEFWAPYFDWTTERAKEVRKQLDGLGLRCHSIHTGVKHFADEHLPHAVDLNHILGSRYVIMAHAGPPPNLDGWRRTAEVLTKASAKLRPQGLSCGYHNWDVDFRPLEGDLASKMKTRKKGSVGLEVVFEVDGCLEVQGAVEARGVVEGLDVVEDQAVSFGPGGGEDGAEALGLEGGPERLPRRVVVAVARAAHALGDLAEVQALPEGRTGVLAAAVAVVEQVLAARPVAGPGGRARRPA